jgi:hypothetical protein
MQRRDFITLFGSAAASWPLAIRAQQRIRRVAVLMGTSDDLEGKSWITGFRQKLQELGWTTGRDLQIDVIWGGADIEYIRTSAAQFVSSKPDVIVVYTVRVLNAVRRLTSQILRLSNSLTNGYLSASRLTARLKAGAMCSRRFRRNLGGAAQARSRQTKPGTGYAG